MGKIQRVYVDTSVIGGCFDKEFEIWSNGLIKDFENGYYKPVVSELVATELVEAPESVKEKYAEIQGFDHEWLMIDASVIDLADAYQKQRILTPKFYDDCSHIALASIADVDVLVSWNFKHIVHLNKIRLFNAVNLANGYKILQVYSPREVTIYGKK